MKLAIPLKILHDVIAKCLSKSIEMIFIGIGITSGSEYRVEEVFICENVSSTPRVKFVADPICLYNIYRYAENKGMDIVVIIHSHPAPPIPSSEDLKGMRLWRIPWLIISSISGEYRAWIFTDGDYREVIIEEI